jgi:hypothetical protein
VQAPQKGYYLRGFFPLKSTFADFFGILKGRQNRTFSVKYYKNINFVSLGLNSSVNHLKVPSYTLESSKNIILFHATIPLKIVDCI